MLSSTSIDMRFRNSIAVGFISISANDITGNSSGKPPAIQTPRFTASAIGRRFTLQFVSSLQELQMPMIGLPSKTALENPSLRSHARRENP
jgi:hypothetical protein